VGKLMPSHAEAEGLGFARTGDSEIVDNRNGNGRSAGSMTEAARQVALHAKKLARLEAELAAIELRQKAREGAAGMGAGATAGYLALMGGLFLFGAIGAALATAIPVWAALLIVTAMLFGGAAIAGLIARRFLSAIPPPVPEQTIDEARRTVEAVRS
jgi:hypothetical protein